MNLSKFKFVPLFILHLGFSQYIILNHSLSFKFHRLSFRWLFLLYIYLGHIDSNLFTKHIIFFLCKDSTLLFFTKFQPNSCSTTLHGHNSLRQRQEYFHSKSNINQLIYPFYYCLHLAISYLEETFLPLGLYTHFQL